jgi:excisionase family DNA binding protein
MSRARKVFMDISASSERFIDADEASRFLGGLNSRTVVRWAREGYLPAYPIGEGKRRIWRFLETDLEAWMLARRNTPEILLDIEASEDKLQSATDVPTGGFIQ